MKICISSLYHVLVISKTSLYVFFFISIFSFFRFVRLLIIWKEGFGFMRIYSCTVHILMVVLCYLLLVSFAPTFILCVNEFLELLDYCTFHEIIGIQTICKTHRKPFKITLKENFFFLFLLTKYIFSKISA